MTSLKNGIEVRRKLVVPFEQTHVSNGNLRMGAS